MIEELEKETHTIKMDKELYEQMLSRFSRILHPNHHIMIDLEFTLIQLLGRRPTPLNLAKNEICADDDTRTNLNERYKIHVKYHLDTNKISKVLVDIISLTFKFHCSPESTAIAQSVSEAERKLNLCRKVLAVIGILTPGKVRMRGMFLSEMYGIIVYLAKYSFGKGKIGIDEYLER